jgi:hypothetical protein
MTTSAATESEKYSGTGVLSQCRNNIAATEIGSAIAATIDASET